MILVEDWKFHICWFLDKHNPRKNISFDNHLLKKNTSSPRLSKYESFYSCHNVLFQRGYPMI